MRCSRLALGEATYSEQEIEEPKQMEKGKPRGADGVEAEEEPTLEVKWRGQKRRAENKPTDGQGRGEALGAGGWE